MKRISYAITAMAFASAFCLFRVYFGKTVFLSAVFALTFTISRSEWTSSVLVWGLSFYTLLIPVLLGIYSEFFVSAIIGHIAYLFMKAVEGNLNFLPSKPIVFSLCLPEKAIIAVSFFVFLGVLLFI